MSLAAALALTVPATVAVLGFLITYRFNLLLARRKDQLDRVNEQLKDLYGPLLALIRAADSSWELFRSQYRRDVWGFWGGDPPPTEGDAIAWRNWITTVFMPLNRQMRDHIVTKAHLIDGEGMPDCLLTLSAHVSAYEPILAQWDRQDFSEHTPAIQFPGEAVRTYAVEKFVGLKKLQQELLRISNPTYAGRRTRMSTMSEELQWTKVSEDMYEARSGTRLYYIRRSQQQWAVALLLDADDKYSSRGPDAQAWASTLEEAKRLAQLWQAEFKLRT